MASMVPREYRTRIKIPASDRDRVKNLAYHKYGTYCYICGTGLDNENKSIDHVIPLSRGGEHCLENVRPCCVGCNTKKGSMSLEDFYNRY